MALFNSLKIGNALVPCLLLAALCGAPVFAEYVGPSGTPTTVAQVLEAGHDHDFVALQGNLIRRADDGNSYQFADASGTILVKIAADRWPAGLKADENTHVAISGKFIKQLVGPDKIEVSEIKAAD